MRYMACANSPVTGVLVALVGVLLAPTTTPAQEVGAVEGYSFEIEGRERWIYARQIADLVWFRDSRRWIYVESGSTTESSAARTIDFAFDQPGGGDGATVVLDSSGAIGSIAGRLAPRRQSPYDTPLDSLRRSYRRGMSGAGSRRVALPESRVWSLVLPVRTNQLIAGGGWTDTVTFAASRGPISQTLTGIRGWTVVKDTMVRGRKLWVVRDSMELVLTTRFLEFVRTMEDFSVVEHSLTGTQLGRSLYDPDLRLNFLRFDTTVLAGEQRVTLADNRSFTTGVAFEQSRTISLRDSTATATRREELLTERRRTNSGMLRFPDSGQDAHMSTASVALRDSLLSAVQDDSNSLPRRRAAYRRLGDWPQAQRIIPNRDQVLQELGDTATYLGTLRRSMQGFLKPISVEMLEEALPFMRDPELAEAFGVPQEGFYENPRQGLLSVPPAVTSDTTAWTCTPDACALLGRQWAEATEPRLKALGLIALAMTDPATWADTVFRLAPESPFLETTADLLRGVGATWGAATKDPLPPAGADWRSWLHWMNGRRTDVPPARDNRVSWRNSHRSAILVGGLVANRDVAAEIASDLQGEVRDSARLVYEIILDGLGVERSHTAQDIAELFRAGSDPLHELAAARLPALFEAAEPLDTVLAGALVNDFLDALIQGAPAWPLIRPGRLSDDVMRQVMVHAEDPVPVLILDRNLPPSARVLWESRATIITEEAWDARSDREAGVLYTLRPALSVGPFISLGAEHTTRQDRTPEESPVGYSGGYGVYLLLTEDGWKIVATNGWVT